MMDRLHVPSQQSLAKVVAADLARNLLCTPQSRVTPFSSRPVKESGQRHAKLDWTGVRHQRLCFIHVHPKPPTREVVRKLS